DWIVMKALEKDRSRRYETATGLVEDLQRYLADQPVLARPPSVAYRFGKFAQRNKILFLAAVLVALALLAGTVVSTWQAVRATHASEDAETARQQAEAARQQAEANEKKANREAIKSRQVAQFLKEMLNGPTPWAASGADTTLLRKILDAAAA